MRYYLKNTPRASDGRYLLYLRVDLNGAYLSARSTRIHLLPREWNASKQTVRRSQPLHFEYNMQLMNLRHQVEKAYLRAMILEGDVAQCIINAIHPTSNSTQDRPHRFDDFVRALLDERRNSITAHSLKQHQYVLADVQSFAKHKQLKRFDFQDIGSQFLSEFLSYLTSVVGNNNTTARKKLRYLRAWLNEADRRGYPINSDYKHFRCSLKTSQIGIALTEIELSSLINFQPQSHRLERVRDIFIFLCSTGLRFIDYKQFHPSRHLLNEDGIMIIRLIQEKTNRPVTFPLLPAAESILKRYDNVLPSISSQKFNKYIKEVGELAGLSSPVEIVNFRGKKKIKKVVPKWKMLSAHVGRRTWATLAYQRGVELQTISKCLGHSGIKQTVEYLRVTDSSYALDVFKVWSDDGN